MSDNPLSNIKNRRVSAEATSLILGDSVPDEPVTQVPVAPVSAPGPVAVPAPSLVEPAAPVPSAPISEVPKSSLVAETATSVVPAMEMSPFDQLEAQSLATVVDKKALNVRVPRHLAEMVNQRSLASKMKGAPLSKDAIVTHALQLYFQLAGAKPQV
jgi:hypothetical protein